MTDIVPVLYEKIHKEFESNIQNNKVIQSFLNRLKDGKATEMECSLYGRYLGECASEALIKYITKENMPDGILYWNIIERTVKPIIEEVFEMTMEAAIIVQKRTDAENGIRTKPVKASFPKERVNSLLNKLANVGIINE